MATAGSSSTTSSFLPCRGLVCCPMPKHQPTQRTTIPKWPGCERERPEHLMVPARQPAHVVEERRHAARVRALRKSIGSAERKFCYTHPRGTPPAAAAPHGQGGRSSFYLLELSAPGRRSDPAV